MSTTLQDRLSQHLPQPGVAAWAACLADRTTATQSYTDWLTPAPLQETITRLTLATDSLFQQGFEPTRLCWTFEHVRIHLARRDDGACLALFVENRPGVVQEKVDQALAEFVNGG